MEDIRGRVDEFTPYVMVAIQESERMNMLLAEIKRSLAELDLGLRGDLTMTEPMERLMKSLATDAVPGSWRNLAYPSLSPLGSWLQNLLQRVQQLIEWTADLGVPKVVWLSGLFNPQSFLTAVMQTTARRNDWPLDKTVVLTEVRTSHITALESPVLCAPPLSLLTQLSRIYLPTGVPLICLREVCVMSSSAWWLFHHFFCHGL